nr:SpaA isopeptide-forming pilin-related protein [Corynebacterium lactis]
MTKRATTQRLHTGAAATIALAFACGSAGIGLGISPALAENVAGIAGVPAIEQSVGTSNLIITLSKGNPDEDGKPVTGSVEGVTIHLHRLAGVNPRNPADNARVDNASLKDIEAWEKDKQFSAVTDANGVVSFENLPEGIYLVTSTAPAGDYREVNKFLVAVPFHTLGESNPVQGVIVAKSHNPGNPPSTPPTVPPTTPWHPTTPSAPGQPTPPEPGNPPQTPGSPGGKSSGPLAITGVQAAGLAVIAAVLIGSGFVIISVNKNRRDKKAKG